ncbi:TadE/TadG family type IV pilus assembly protein [Streptomyces sp. NPDC002164]|uniref:TadE/TadG family type IV pilus assembly protein n=1 Tax=Streptomyces sp. NPDC002164 TaxID=3364633 RepID=UPI0036CC244D
MTRQSAATRTAPKSHDRGSTTVFFALSTIAILMVIGLLVDGGGALIAGNRATSLAQEAARAAGRQITRPRRSKAPPSPSTQTLP